VSGDIGVGRFAISSTWLPISPYDSFAIAAPRPLRHGQAAN